MQGIWALEENLVMGQHTEQAAVPNLPLIYIVQSDMFQFASILAFLTRDQKAYVKVGNKVGFHDAGEL